MAKRVVEEKRSFPCNLDAERAVLGAVLLDGEVYDQAGDVVAEADFYRAAHRHIFAAMARLSAARAPIELVTLREELARAGDTEEAGGPAYLTALVDGLPRGANVAAYAAIVAEKARLRAAIATATRLSAEAHAAERPSAELAAEAAEALHALGGAALAGQAVSLADLVAPSLEALERAVAKGTGTVTGLATGFTALDELTAGLQAGDLVLVAARTSQGKTALALNIARALEVPTLIFSLEMSRQQVFMRLLAAEARVDSHRLRSGYLSSEDWGRIARGVGTLAERALWVDDQPAIGVRQLRSRARQVQARHGLGAVVVDYLQLMRGHGQFDNRTQEIGTISRGLKAVARELEVPVVALAQLSRQAEPGPGRKARRPQLSDLAESGSLENDADVVVFIYRPEPKDEEADDVAELIVAKQRNGPTGIVRVAWNKSIVRFENLAGPAL